MGGVVLDLPPLHLAIYAAAIPLAVLLAALAVPPTVRAVLPKRQLEALRALLSPPGDGGLAAEREGREADEQDGPQEQRVDRKVSVLAALGAAETVGWTAGTVAAAVRVASSGGGKDGWVGVGALGGVAVAWALSTLLLLPRKTPSHLQAPAPMLHFAFYTLHLVFLVLHAIHLGLHRPPRPNLDVYLTTLHTLVLLALLLTACSMPLQPTPVASPAPTAAPADVAEQEVDDAKDVVHLESPEQAVTLGSTLSFSWVGGLIEKGKKAKLGYRDVWKLPETMQSEGVQRSAAELKSTRIVPRIFWNNARDICVSLSLGLLSSALSYLAPYFLKAILESLTSAGDKTLRQSAYIYALLAFFSQIARAEVDLIHLSTERRAITRCRTQLMGEVYAKALKRKDVSGVVLPKADEAKEEGKGKKADEGAKKKDAKDGKKKKVVPEGRGSSSTGKIVSLMGGDSNKVAQQLMQLSSIFGAPFELIIAITFLYQLLGWTCFAGLLVMALAIPLNHLLVKRRVTIHRSMLSARDARMEVLNELIQAVRFIKYSAAEGDWLKRANVARENELGWLLKTRMNNLLINALWNFSPDLVMLVAFACYTLVLRRDLDVPTAFASLAVFTMVRAPLTQLPMSFVSLTQTWVSIQRLEQFFGEPEVEPWVSALRAESEVAVQESEQGVGIEDGTFAYGEDAKAEKAAPAAAADAAAQESETPAAPEEPKFELKDINVSFPVGKLSLVCGATGSGKSSLFLALLGEMTRLSGRIHLAKTGTSGSALDSNGLYDGVAYAAQLPWLQHMSIKENILFGAPYEKERYDAVLDACALRADLDMFDAGDETEIGERGISLSGGQKARVALARAVYSRAKVVLLDDPLSAVDSHTARHLYRKCLCGPLLENRTVILITHHISLCLGAAAYVVRLSEGRIALQAPVDELDKAELTTELVEDDDEAEETEKADALEAKGKGRVQPEDPKEAEHAAAAALAPSTSASTATPTREPSPALVVNAPDAKGGAGKLVEAESRATGRVKWNVYKLYLSSAGYFTWTAMVVLIFLGRAGRVGDRSWFKAWGESYRTSDTMLFRMFMPQSSQIALTSFDAQTADLLDLPKLPSASDNVEFYLIGYALICLLNLAITVIGILSAFQGSFRASRKLFSDTLSKVVYAPFRYFDQTPTGRILNRFSTDFNTVDGSLVDSFRITGTHVSSFIVNVLVVIIVSPTFIPPAFLIIYAYIRYALAFVRTSRDLRRLESNARSPIYSKFGETLHGIVTCRAFGAERRFLKGVYQSIDTMQAVAYSSAMANRYLLWRFDCLGAAAVAVTTLLALGAGASPGYAALAITSAQSLVQSVYWASRFVSQLEVDLNAVERVVDLLATPSEPPQIMDKRPPAVWPSSVGGISLENLVISYAPSLPPVINDVTLDIPPTSKVGLVGRTGSGKSTLAMSLLRFVDPTAGRIIIDGIDITQIGLHDLRRAVTLIPQEAVLFSGTVRSNLDPFSNFTDAECLEVLERVGLINTSTAPASLATTPAASAVPSRSVSPAPPAPSPAPAEAEAGDGRLVVPVQSARQSVQEPSPAASEIESSTTTKVANGSSGRLSVTLETPVSAGGNNFSAGQRQLLALARALLRRSSVIIMDEATASVDFETDEKIQRVVQDDFADSLVLTIAHRLRSIVTYDLVCVLDKGRVVEFAKPAELMRNKDGVFRAMCEKAADWRDLREMAGLGEDE
ncbi:hypothetical protein JCM10213_008267 [Rhodosporidiobolus nylandii]